MHTDTISPQDTDHLPDEDFRAPSDDVLDGDAMAALDIAGPLEVDTGQASEAVETIEPTDQEIIDSGDPEAIAELLLFVVETETPSDRSGPAKVDEFQQLIDDNPWLWHVRHKESAFSINQDTREAIALDRSLRAKLSSDSDEELSPSTREYLERQMAENRTQHPTISILPEEHFEDLPSDKQTLVNQIRDLQQHMVVDALKWLWEEQYGESSDLDPDLAEKLTERIRKAEKFIRSQNIPPVGLLKNQPIGTELKPNTVLQFERLVNDEFLKFQEDHPEVDVTRVSPEMAEQLRKIDEKQQRPTGTKTEVIRERINMKAISVTAEQPEIKKPAKGTPEATRRDRKNSRSRRRARRAKTNHKHSIDKS